MSPIFGLPISNVYTISNVKYPSSYMTPKSTGSAMGDPVVIKALASDDTFKFTLKWDDENNKTTASLKCQRPDAYIAVDDKSSGTSLVLSKDIFSWNVKADGTTNNYFIYVPADGDPTVLLYANVGSSDKETEIKLSNDQDGSRWLFQRTSL